VPASHVDLDEEWIRIRLHSTQFSDPLGRLPIGDL
jgi:hypothetical protein